MCNCANSGGKWIAPKKRKAIYIRDDLACVYCKDDINDGIEFTLDHVIPQELGGSNAATNLVTACKKCNSQKQNKSLSQFMKYLEKKGIDTKKVKNRVRRNTRRKLKGYNCRINGNKK
jgi:5-methylcytosine-specific restriction endonuclease McrA